MCRWQPARCCSKPRQQLPCWAARTGWAWPRSSARPVPAQAFGSWFFPVWGARKWFKGPPVAAEVAGYDHQHGYDPDSAKHVDA